ncbi:MAG: Zn-ribbon domain-containing OB-fold protein [Chloroflexi bacterium]|nr:Zn-ribbon domain-containing OB-fold protein [Chloroflexota bacterium]
MATEQTQDLIIVPCGIHGEMNMTYRWGAGDFLSKAFEELRDNGKIYANECPQCGRYHLPPRKVCGRCHVEMDGFDKWVQVGPRGTVLVYTVTLAPFLDPETGKPRHVPYCVATIQLDGAPCALEHFLKETNPENLKVGMRVEAVLKPEAQRKGDLGDIIHFKTVQE